MKTANHHTSNALNTWAAVFVLLFVAGVIAYFVTDEVTFLVAGAACLFLRPLFRALSVLVRASETSLFSKDDPDFVIERKDKEA